MNLSASDLAQIETILGRVPSEVEKHIFDTMWSEHCSYKSSKEILKAHLPTKGSEVALGIGEDSGIVRFAYHNGKQYCIAISHESHNHPSQILPVEGAATGVGGVVRDVYCMGADVIGVLNSLHFGVGSDHAREIERGVIFGVSDYANPLGVPVLGGETVYHASYNDNCLVNVAALGLVTEDAIIHSYVPEQAKTEPYDVILLGKSTDATGFGGASFSSTTLDTDDKATNVGAVQVHDPFLKRVLVEAIKAMLKVVADKQVPIGFKDLGAGGISCVTSEIAAASGFGVVVHLDTVNTAIPHLSPEIIACSETQERFCVVVPRWFTPEVLACFNETFALPELYPNAGAVVVGEVLNEPVYRLIHKGKMVTEIPIQAITTEVRVQRQKQERPLQKQAKPYHAKASAQTIAQALLNDRQNQSMRRVYRFFDNAVRGDAVVYPGEADACVVTPIPGCDAAVAVSIDSNVYGTVDPYISGAYAVAEGVRNVVAVGARPLALTDCLNYGNPENPSVFFDFEQGVRGIADSARGLSFLPGEPIPIISGNVSFYNDSKQGTAVVPSPVIVVVGKLEAYQKAVTLQVHEADLQLILLGKRYAEFGGTQVAPWVSEAEVAPQVRFEEEQAMNQAMYTLNQKGLLQAAHDISSGGAWQTLVEMVVGEHGLAKVGMNLNTPQNAVPFLFSENGGYVMAVKGENVAAVTAILEAGNVVYEAIGTTTLQPFVRLQAADESLEFAVEALVQTREAELV